MRDGDRRSRLALAAAALLALAFLLGACGSSDELPPPAEPAVSPPVSVAPDGRVVDVGHMPEGVVADPATGLVAVGLRDPDRLALVDGRSGEVVRRTPLPEAPRHLQLAAPGGPVLVPAEGADALLEVSLPDGRIAARTPGGEFPHDAAAVGDRRFVADEFGDAVSVVEDGRAIATLDAPVQPGGVAALGRETVGVVAVRGNVLRVYDARTLRPLGDAGAGAGPTHIVADPVAERFFIADTRGEALLFSIAGERPEIFDRLNLPGPPYGLAIDPRRRRIWVTLPASNELAEVELEGNEPTVVRTYPTVRQPNSVAVDPKTGTLFVAGRAGGELEIIRPDP
ncbi:MAG: YncE family protein [Thermoleophilaceae bacterium]